MLLKQAAESKQLLLPLLLLPLLLLLLLLFACPAAADA
jgi:hypothetical protein